MDETRELWNKAAAFHGHVCGGLTIGYKAALYAIELLGLTFSPDEELVCVAEKRRLRLRRHPGHSGVQRGQGESALPHDGQAGLLLL